jgi:hypothetical protein
MTSAMSTLRSNQSELTALTTHIILTNFCVGKCKQNRFFSVPKMPDAGNDHRDIRRVGNRE